MMLLITIILALGLLAGMIYLLRNQRLRALSEAAEREQPLPPLPALRETDPEAVHESAAVMADLPRQSVTATAGNEEISSPLLSSAEISLPVAEKPAAAASNTAADARDSIPAVATTRAEIIGITVVADPGDWKAESQRLRQSGDYEAALAQCDRGWPQMQSFQQSALVIRAALRDLLDKHTLADGACPDSLRAIWLERLFIRAARASFLYDKVAGLPDPNWQMLGKHFSQQEVSALPMRWRELGYKKLRLLNQSDCKALVELFGEPEVHRSARELHREHWQIPD